jgi:hypothetical protein
MIDVYRRGISSEEKILEVIIAEVIDAQISVGKCFIIFRRRIPPRDCIEVQQWPLECPSLKLDST